MTDFKIDPRSIQLKAMKGNDLKVLVAMFLLGAINIGNKLIKSFTGLSYPTVSSCLDNLSSLGMVTKTHRIDGWQITDGGFQLLLPTDSSTNFLHSEAIINIDKPLSTIKIKDLNINNTEASAKIFDSEIVKALFEMGIYNPKATDLACMEHITFEYISSWKLALKHSKIGKTGKDIGLAIHLMIQNAPAPVVTKAEQEVDICHVCGNEALNHGKVIKCPGRYNYTFGKRNE